jgi:hypothetical protein
MAAGSDAVVLLRAALAGTPALTEKRMMGGTCFLMNGNMVCGADRGPSGLGRFMFRVGKTNEALALARPGASLVEMGGRRMGGFVFVEAQAAGAEALPDWVALARGYVETLPPKG